MAVGSTLAYGTVSIGTSAAIIKAGVSTRKTIVVQNLHATNALYLGGDVSITTSNTIRVAAGESFAFNDYSGAVYGIASGASTDVRYLEIR